MQQENWRPVTSFSNYMVSDLGRVKNIKFNRVLKQYYSEGYPQVSLSQDGKRNVRRVHLIVADEFIPNPDNLPYVNHLDGNRANPALYNLERCTPKQNSEHAVKMGLYNPIRIPKHVFCKENVKIITIKRRVNT